jgi:hypothetical protein
MGKFHGEDKMCIMPINFVVLEDHIVLIDINKRSRILGTEKCSDGRNNCFGSRGVCLSCKEVIRCCWTCDWWIMDRILKFDKLAH